MNYLVCKKLILPGLLIMVKISLGAIAMPNLMVPDGAIDNATLNIPGSGSYRNEGWYEYDNWNGAIHSSEYVAYNFKFLPIADYNPIIRLKGGHPRGFTGQFGFSYVLACYTQDGNCIGDCYFAWPGSWRDPKDLQSARLRGCKVFGACGGPACVSQAWMSNQKDVQAFLTNQLNLIVLRLVGKGAGDNNLFYPTYANVSNAIKSAGDPRTCYDQLWNKMAGDNRITSYSVGTLGHYVARMHALLTGAEPFPMSDTSDVMFFPKDSSQGFRCFSRHPLYLYFSANQYARNLALSDYDQRNLLTLILLMHRFRLVYDEINKQLAQQAPDIASIYEYIALVRILNPNAQGVPSVATWVDNDSAMDGFENLSVDQLGALVDAASAINDKIPDEIAGLISINLFTVGQLFNWSTARTTV